MMDVGNVSNTTDPPTLPEDMVYNDGHRISIIVNSILMVVSAIGNLTVLVILAHRRRTSPSRINVTLMHLAIADLLVTFLTIPLEIGWAATVSWRAGDTMCRIMAYLRVFGIYLSSFVLVCISIDRYYAVLKPLQLCAIDRRGRYMLAAAWVGSAISSIPQALIFHEEQHPVFTWYKQCVSFNAFTTYVHEVGYSMFGMVLMYIFPLTIIICSYTAILTEIFRRSREPIGASFNLGRLGKARIRTLKMTVIIVVVFFVCWTPYHVMAFWYMIDKESAHKVDLRVQKGLFLFACTNSCMNPIVYGAFNIRPRRATAQMQNLNHSLNSQHRNSRNRDRDVMRLVSWRKARRWLRKIEMCVSVAGNRMNIPQKHQERSDVKRILVRRSRIRKLQF